MRIDKLSKGRNKKIVLVITILLLTIGIIYITNSKAKYQITKSVSIVNGKINYDASDLNVMALSVQESEDSENYNIENEIPEGSYEVNTQKSYCKYPGDNTEYRNIPMEYKDNKVYIGINKKGTKCYVYLDIASLSKKTLDNLELSSNGTVDKITGPSCNGSKGASCYTSGTDNKTNNMAQNGVYEAEDDYGTSYVFRGSIDNNFVKFGKMNSNQGSDANKDIWWRIIRINGNGTIRLIYAGITSGTDKPSTTGANTQIKTTYSDNNTRQQYNETYNDNRYVGFMYGNSNSTYELTHNNNQKSTIMGELETWYDKTTLGPSGKLDVETGFCNDRQIAPSGTNTSYTGTGKQDESTAYAPWGRLYYNNTLKTEQTPTLKCGYDTTNQSTNETSRKRDLFTGPSATEGGTEVKNGKVEGNNILSKAVGLITSDEVVYAGGFGGQSNSGYWLYTYQNYWTMSPHDFNNNSAKVFIVNSNGYLTDAGVGNTYNTYGVRPVINLKADAQFGFRSGDSANIGTVDNPYVVL